MTTRIALFPGQGQLPSDLGLSLCKRYIIAKDIYEKASEIIGYNLIERGYYLGNQKYDTSYAQPLLFTYCYALFKVYQEKFALSFDYFAGHSLGEFTALAASGFLKFEDGIKLVNIRSRVMESVKFSEKTGMRAVSNIHYSKVEGIIASLEEEAEIACYNAPTQTVISGYDKSLDLLTTHLLRGGATVTSLKVNKPFHSTLMRSAVELMASYIADVSLYPSNNNVISSVTGNIISNIDEIRDNFIRQIVDPVRWVDAMETISLCGVTHSIEFCTHKVLSNLLNTYESETISEEVEKILDDEWRIEKSNLFLQSQDRYVKCAREYLRLIASLPNWNESLTHSSDYSKEFKKYENTVLIACAMNMDIDRTFVNNIIFFAYEVIKIKNVPISLYQTRLEELNHKYRDIICLQKIQKRF